MADGRTPNGADEGGSPDRVGPAPAVRPFLVTAGRVAPTSSGRTMPVETQVVATAEGLDALDRLSFEQHDIIAACRQPQSIAEIAARLRLHLNVVRILSEDLRAAGQLTVYVPNTDATHDSSVLRRVIDGLRAIPDSRGYSVTPTEPVTGGAAAQTAVRPPLPVKMVIAGGFGVGKTTAVGSISEIEPLTTEAAITEVAAGVDDLSHTPRKTTTTVAMDFGCITIDPTLKLYLFGTPGQDRFGFMWDDIVEGSIGGLVIVDTRRLDDCYAAVDYFEHKQIPFAVAVNAFDGKVEHELDEVRWALDVAEHVPLVVFDARERGSVRDALLVVLELALARSEG